MSTSTSRNFTKRGTDVSFTSADHIAMNQAVFEDISGLCLEVKSVAELHWVISSIVDNSQRKLTIPEKRVFLDLFSDAEFLALVNQCLKKEEYNDLRELELFHPRRELTPDPRPQTKAEMKQVIAAFQSEFKGEHHLLLDSVIQRLWDDFDYLTTYGLYMPFIQSSGMGKSRLLDELAKRRFTIAMNLRYSSSDSFAYPPADASLQSFFDKNFSKEPFADCKLKIAAFFVALFMVSLENLKGSATKNNEHLAAEWRTKYMDPNQDSEGHARRQSFYSDVVSRVPGLASQYAGNLEAIISVIVARARDLETAIVDAWKPSKIPFLVYFDEAHVLTQDTTAPKNILDAMVSVLADLAYAEGVEKSKLPFFVVFLSTASQFAKYSPPLRIFPSSRVSEAKLKVKPNPSYVFTPFDIMARGTVQEGLTLGQVCGIDFIKRFGRPMFSSLKDPLPLAETKLRGTTGVIGSPSSNPQAAKDFPLAALACRILVDFHPLTQSNRDLEGRLVEAHLRVVFNIPWHQEFMVTGFPSEPLLAEAASLIMNEKGYSAPQVLRDFLDMDSIDRGDTGELVARMLLILGRDHYVNTHTVNAKSLGADTGSSRAHPPMSIPGIPKYSHPIRLMDYLNALLRLNRPPGPNTEKLELTPAKIAILEKAFDGYWVHFSHFIRAADDSMASPDVLWRLMARGAALQGHHSLKDIDVVLPVIVGQPGQDFKDIVLNEESITAVSVSVKNRVDPVTEPAQEFSTLRNKKHNRLSIVLNLGDSQNSYPSIQLKPLPPHYEEKKICYSLVVFGGVTEELYPFVTGAEEVLYAQILNDRDFTKEIPEPMQPYMKHVADLKPNVWTGKSDTVLSAGFWNWSAKPPKISTRRS